MPWAKSFCPFRACCFCEFFLTIRACCFHELLGHQGVLLWAYWASGRAASISILAIRACCFCEFFDHQGELLWASGLSQPLSDSCPCGRIPQTAALLLAKTSDGPPTIE
nr:hypothetical protein [uncultured Prevotella sp.]